MNIALTDDLPEERSKIQKLVKCFWTSFWTA